MITDWDGRVGHAWAVEWQHTDRSFGGLTRELLARIAPLPGCEVLDLGCGAGELSLALAAARPEARVTGLDVGHELLAAAQARADGRANPAFVLGDASVWKPEVAPDLVVSRHGVMFFDDPRAAFAHIAGFAATGANLVFSCFRPVAENPWAGAVAAAVAPGATPPRPAGYMPGPFGFGDRAFVEAMLVEAGWRDVAVTPVDYDYVAGEGADPVADAMAFLRRIGPAAAPLRSLPRDEREAAEARLAAVLEARLAAGRIVWPAAAWIVTARAPA